MTTSVEKLTSTKIQKFKKEYIKHLKNFAETKIKKKYGIVNSKSRLEIRNRLSGKYQISEQKEFLERQIDADIQYFRIQRNIDGENLDDII